jgi:ribose transport system permease protein
MLSKNRIVKNISISLVPPALVFIVLMILTSLFGKPGFASGSDLLTIIYNMVFSGCIALAMSYNLTSGRLDFSIGSVLILSLIAGGSLAKMWDVGPIGFVILVIGFGLFLGLCSGFMYITLRLPAMVTSLGVTMIYESIGFMLNEGKGVRLIGRFDMLIWARPPYNLLLLGFLLVILIFLHNFTKFGYDAGALEGGQKNAVEVGVNENINALISYTIAGAIRVYCTSVRTFKFFIHDGCLSPCIYRRSSCTVLRQKRRGCNWGFHPSLNILSYRQSRLLEFDEDSY